MPDVHGPWDGSTFGQGPYYRDRGPLEPSGVLGAPSSTPGGGELGLTAAGFALSLSLGRAHVRGAAYERTGTAWTYTVPANTNPTQPRIDRLVLRRDLVAKTVVPVVLQGTPAASPAPPALSTVENGAYDEPLFRFTVPANSGTPLVITDERRWIGDGIVGAPPLFVARRVSAHALGLGAFQTIPLDTPVINRGGFVVNGSGQVVIPFSANYLVSGQVNVMTVTTGGRLYAILARISPSPGQIYVGRGQMQGAADLGADFTQFVPLNAGDVVALQGFQDNLSTVNVGSQLYAPTYLQLAYHSPLT